MFRGSVIDSEYKGLSTIELMNYLSPDVVSLGNHEVDYGIAHLLFLEKCAKFPIINADLYIKLNNQRLFNPYKIVNINGIRVMFIGIITDEVLQQTKNEQLIGSFIDLWKAKEEIGVIIDNYKTTKIDLTVLLTHIGLNRDIELAKILDPKWGIDLIIGGHSHSKLDNAVIVNNIPMTMMYSSILSGTSNMKLVYATIMGSNIGALLTPVGALAGIMWMRILKENGIKYTFINFMKNGFIITLFLLISCGISLFIL